MFLFNTRTLIAIVESVATVEVGNKNDEQERKKRIKKCKHRNRTKTHQKKKDVFLVRFHNNSTICMHDISITRKNKTENNKNITNCTISYLVINRYVTNSTLII